MGNCSWLTSGTRVQNMGFWVGDDLKTTIQRLKYGQKNAKNLVAPPSE